MPGQTGRGSDKSTGSDHNAIARCRQGLTHHPIAASKRLAETKQLRWPKGQPRRGQRRECEARLSQDVSVHRARAAQKVYPSIRRQEPDLLGYGQPRIDVPTGSTTSKEE
jgi:hypothetical protein